jgi:fluoroacetyl-CoA thioesterase
MSARDALRPGLTNEYRVTVTMEMTAARFGNAGVEVLATPYLVGLIETAAALLVIPYLEPGQASVGTHVDVRHLGPSPVGAVVTARAQLASVAGERLAFRVEADDGVEVIASGEHERFVIDLDRFYRGLNKKRSAGRRSDM